MMFFNFYMQTYNTMNISK